MADSIYYAHLRIHQDGTRLFFHASPSRRWVELHMVSLPIVEVLVRECTPEDEPSAYWGWESSDDLGRYIFIWPSEVQLDMCFAYGPKVEEARGRGRKVNLVVRERSLTTVPQ